jgi:protein-disulfide isomerase
MTTCFSILAALSACGGTETSELEALRREVAEIKQAQAELQATVANLQGNADGPRGNKARAWGRPAPDAGRRDVIYRIPTGGSPRKGNDVAAVTVVQFADFQCAYCQGAARLSDELLEAYPEDVLFVFKHYPLHRHQQAREAAKAAWAAQQQGKFWDMHDLIYAGDINQITSEDLRRYAKQIGLDMDRFEADMASPKAEQAIAVDKRLARTMKIGGTPAYFVNGRRVTDRSPAGVRAMVDAELAKRKQTAS